MSFNDGATITLRGRVATDPVTKVTEGGKQLVKFRVICSRRYFDRTAGEWVDGDSFAVTVLAWNTVGTGARDHLRIGDAVVIEGTIATRSYVNEGVTSWVTEVKADLIALDVMWLRGEIDRTKGRRRSDQGNAGTAEATGSSGVQEPPWGSPEAATTSDGTPAAAPESAEDMVELTLEPAF